MNLHNKKISILLFFILALSFFINITTFKNGHNWENSDFVGYISQARGLVDGDVDALISHDKFIIENSTKDTGTIMGLWSFPLILTPVYYVFGPDIYLMKVATNLFFILSLLVLFLLFRDRLDSVDNILLVIVLAFNPWFFDFKDNVLTDIPFLFFSLVVLLLIKKFVILREIWVNRFISYLLVGVLIFISYNTRATGLILLPTLLSVQYFNNRSSMSSRGSLLSDKFNYVPYLVFVLLFAITWLTVPGSDAASVYFDAPSQMNIKRFIFDVKYYTVLPSRFFPFLFLNMHGYGFEYNKFSLVIYGVMLLFVFWGMVKNFREDYIFIIYMIITIPVLMFFSSRQGFRLLIPIIPFFMYFLFKGLSGVFLSFEGVNNAKPVKISIAYLFCAGLIIISMAYISGASYKNIMFNRTGAMEGPYSADSLGLFNYIKANTDKDAAVIFHEPRSMYLFADRKSFALSKGKFKFDQLLNSRAGYLACEKKENPYKLTPEDLRNSFDCPYENDTFILCSLKK